MTNELEDLEAVAELDFVADLVPVEVSVLDADKLPVNVGDPLLVGDPEAVKVGRELVTVLEGD